MKIRRGEQGFALLAVLYSLLIFCTALMVVNSYLQYRCSRVTRMHRELVALNLAESGIAYWRPTIDAGRVSQGKSWGTFEFGGGTVEVQKFREGNKLTIRSSGTFRGTTRTVEVTGRIQNGRFRPEAWK